MNDELIAVLREMSERLKSLESKQIDLHCVLVEQSARLDQLSEYVRDDLDRLGTQVKNHMHAIQKLEGRTAKLERAAANGAAE